MNIIAEGERIPHEIGGSVFIPEYRILTSEGCAMSGDENNDQGNYKVVDMPAKASIENLFVISLPLDLQGRDDIVNLASWIVIDSEVIFYITFGENDILAVHVNITGSDDDFDALVYALSTGFLIPGFVRDATSEIGWRSPLCVPTYTSVMKRL